MNSINLYLRDKLLGVGVYGVVGYIALVSLLNTPGYLLNVGSKN